MGNCCPGSNKNQQKIYIKTQATSRELKQTYDLNPKLLGSGSFGKVFLATDKKDQNIKIAVKVMKKSNLSQEDLDSLRNEVQIMQSVDHPNIVEYYETYEDQGYIYLCMELCTGGELIEKLTSAKDNHLSEKLCAEYMLKLFKALNHCHAQDIIHRDIKPENIMFGADNEIKFIDFGFAISQHQKKAKMEVMGTPYYVAPEVLTGYYGKECDIWSLGVCLYQILTGNMPFDGNNQEEVFNKIKEGKFNIDVDLSDECKDLLKKMIKVNVNKRINIEDAINHQWIKININKDHQDSKKLNPQVINNLKKFRGSSTLKKAAVNILVKHLDQSQLISLKEEFEKIDTDFSGFIELKELETIMKSSGQHMSHSEIQQIIQQIDYSDNHMINYSEFLAATINVKEYLTNERALAIFHGFDIHDTGFITEKQLQQGFSKQGRQLSQLEIQQIMKAHDINGDNKISFDEFKIMLENEL